MYAYIFLLFALILGSYVNFIYADNKLAALGLLIIALATAFDIIRLQLCKHLGKSETVNSNCTQQLYPTIIKWMRHILVMTGIVVLIIGIILKN